MYKNKYIKLIGSPKIFSFLVIWLMVLVFFGTLVQKDIGLYAAQQEYFSSWFKWISFIPLPRALPISGTLPAPNITRTITRIIVSSGQPSPNGIAAPFLNA